MAFAVTESDQSLGATIALLSSAATVLLIGIVAAPPAAPVIGGVVAIMLATGAILTLINGDDDKGIGTTVAMAPGTHTTNTAGPDGGAEIKWRVETEEIDLPDCNPDPTPTPSPTPVPTLPPVPTPGGQNCKNYFDLLRDTMAQSNESEVEEGIDVTPEEFEVLQDQAEETLVTGAGALIDALFQIGGGNLADAGRVIQLGNLGDAQLAAGFLSEALATYETACLAAFQDGAGDVMGDTDCDGKVTAVDGLFDLRLEAGLHPLRQCLGTGDITCNLNIDVLDALGIARAVAGLSVPPPPIKKDCTPIGDEPEPAPVPTPTATPPPTETPIEPTGEPTGTGEPTPTQTPTETPPPTPTPTATATPTPVATPCPGDDDCDGVNNAVESGFGSDHNDPNSTPEHRLYDIQFGDDTCMDGADNDLDVLTDGADPDCAKPPMW